MGALKQLVAESARTPKPEPSERGRLLKRAAVGDRPAQQQLFQSHVDMLIRQAVSRGDRGLSIGELVQEGSLGLIDAISSFADSGRVDFDRYAEERVSQQMETALELEATTTREAGQLLEDARAYERAEISVRKEKGRPPTDSELATKLEWPVERTRLLGEMVAEARRKHDEELMGFLDPEARPEEGDQGRETGTARGG